MLILECDVIKFSALSEEQIVNSTEVHPMSKVTEVSAIDVDAEFVRCHFYFELERFPLVEGEVRDIPLLLLPVTINPTVAYDSIFALSWVDVQGDILTVVIAIFL